MLTQRNGDATLAETPTTIPQLAMRASELHTQICTRRHPSIGQGRSLAEAGHTSLMPSMMRDIVPTRSRTLGLSCCKSQHLPNARNNQNETLTKNTNSPSGTTAQQGVARFSCNLSQCAAIEKEVY
jgi:hypothetical protein